MTTPITTTGKSKKKSGFYIGVTCPGCGGNLELEENFFVLECDHCGSTLRIQMPDIPPGYLVQSRKNRREVRFGIDRYLKEKKLPLTSSDISYTWFYYPFWKIDGILLKLRNEIIERAVGLESEYTTTAFGGYNPAPEPQVRQDKNVNISLTPYSQTMWAGTEADEIPTTLGLRVEYLKMLPFASENIEDGYECAPVLKPWVAIKSQIEKGILNYDRANMGDFGKNQSRLFHPRGSIVYFPYCFVINHLQDKSRMFIVDCVAGRVETMKESDNRYTEPIFGDDKLINFGKLEVNFHRCGNCGVDLPGEQSYIYICKNCHELTMLGENRSINQVLKSVKPDNPHPKDRYFPFWAMRVSDKDSAQLRRLFGGIYKSEYLVIPGFRAPNFEAIFRLSKRVSAAYPKLSPEPIDVLPDNFNPVTIGLEEALTFAEVAIHREKTMRKKSIGDQSEGFYPTEIELFYAPFHPESYFYVDSAMGAVTFEKNMAIE